MPCEVRWLEKPYVIEVVLSGLVSDDEVDSLADQVIAMVEETGMVDAITLLNVKDLKKLPAFNMLRNGLGRIPEHFEGEKLGLSVAYGLNTLVRYAVELLSKVTGMRFKIFDTREEAESFVWQMVEIKMQEETVDSAQEDTTD